MNGDQVPFVWFAVAALGFVALAVIAMVDRFVTNRRRTDALSALEHFRQVAGPTEWDQYVDQTMKRSVNT